MSCLSLSQLKRLKKGDLINIDLSPHEHTDAMVLEHQPVQDFLKHEEKPGIKLLVLASNRIAYLSYDVLRWTFPTTLISTI
jgi:hypothetical protein